jgi:hypothetical protein
VTLRGVTQEEGQETLRIVQLSHPDLGRRVALVEEPHLRLLQNCTSVFDLATSAIKSNRRLRLTIEQFASTEQLEYDSVYQDRSDWRLLPPIDHPEPSRCFVTGTGLTHKASAENRQSMHVSQVAEMSDSMRMYHLGLDGGRPSPGCIGAEPEWFYKGAGRILRAANQPLHVPAHGEDGGEEAEIAGVYLIGDDGTPFCIGLTQGNEFSDHVLESKNYLYLAASKLRECALGPELVIEPKFDDVPGRAAIERGGHLVWQAPQSSGERWMCHTLANLEHHHFKHDEHRRAGDVHVHFFGADMFSFKDRLKLEDGDVMAISFEGFGRPLRNPIRIDHQQQPFVSVKAL